MPPVSCQGLVPQRTGAQNCLLLAVNQFPAEEVRRALGDRIQLTENQVQVSAVSPLVALRNLQQGLVVTSAMLL